jgi:hypothetical protein
VSFNFDDIFGTGNSSTKRKNPLDVGNFVGNKKNRKKGGFDDILGMAGIGTNSPFVGFSQTENQGDFARPVKRKRRSREAIALGVRDDSAIFGLQNFGNAVGRSENFLDTEIRPKIASDGRRIKKAVKQTGRFQLTDEIKEMDIFTTDPTGRTEKRKVLRKTGRRVVVTDKLGNPVKSTNLQDTVVFGRELNPKVKGFIDNRIRSSRLKKHNAMKKGKHSIGNPQSTPQPTLFRSNLIPETVVPERIRGAKGKKQKKRMTTGEPINILPNPLSEDTLTAKGKKQKKRMISNDQINPSVFGDFQGDIDKKARDRKEKQRAGKVAIRNMIAGRIMSDTGSKSVLDEIGNAKSVTNITGQLDPNRFDNEKKRPLVIADGKKFARRKELIDNPKKDAPFLSSLQGITDRMESNSVDARTNPVDVSKLGGSKISKRDSSPIGDQADVRIKKGKKKGDKADVLSFFAKSDADLKESKRVPTTFATATDDQEMSDIIFKDGVPVTTKEEAFLINERKQKGFMGDNLTKAITKANESTGGKAIMLTDELNSARPTKDGVEIGTTVINTPSATDTVKKLYTKGKRPDVKMGDLYSQSELKEGESLDDLISDDEFVASGETGALPSSAQRGFDMRINKLAKTKSQKISEKALERGSIQRQIKHTEEVNKINNEKDMFGVSHNDRIKDILGGIDASNSISGTDESNKKKIKSQLTDALNSGTIDDAIKREERTLAEQQASFTTSKHINKRIGRKDGFETAPIGIDPDKKTSSGKQSQKKVQHSQNHVDGQFVPTVALRSRQQASFNTREVIKKLKEVKSQRMGNTTSQNTQIGINSIDNEFPTSELTSGDENQKKLFDNVIIPRSDRELKRKKDFLELAKDTNNIDIIKQKQNEVDEEQGRNDFLKSSDGISYIEERDNIISRKKSEFKRKQREQAEEDAFDISRIDPDTPNITKQLSEREKDKAGIVDDFGDITEMARSSPTTNIVKELKERGHTDFLDQAKVHSERSQIARQNKKTARSDRQREIFRKEEEQEGRLADDLMSQGGVGKLTEEQKDKAGIVDDFGDITEMARSSPTTNNRFEEFRAKQSTMREGGDGIKITRDNRKTLDNPDLPNLTFLNKLEKAGVNKPRVKIGEEFSREDDFNTAVDNGTVTSDGLIDELEKVKADKDTSKETRRLRKKRIERFIGLVSRRKNKNQEEMAEPETAIRNDDNNSLTVESSDAPSEVPTEDTAEVSTEEISEEELKRDE